jgi:2-polyprenyl-3-methyl-5-hydroxy-6-metoxy-1,4-benzoquinol methylase
MMNIKQITLTHCPLCASNAIHLRMTSSDFDTNTGDYGIYQCENCQIHFTNPQVNEADIGQLYAERTSGDFLPNNAAFTEKLRQWRASFIVNNFFKQLNRKDVSILDIGCGDGLYSVALAQHSACQKLLAVDFHEIPPQRLFKTHLATIRYESMNRLAEEKERYDVIFCRHVVEHTVNPIDFLCHIKPLLNESGTVFIEVPNFNCIWRKLLGQYYCNLFLPRHFFHFEQKTLLQVVENAGFSVESSFSAHLPSLGWSIRNRFKLQPLRKIGLLELALFPIEVIINLLCGQPTCLGMIIKKSTAVANELNGQA